MDSRWRRASRRRLLQAAAPLRRKLLVADVPGLDHALLAVRDRDERAELDELFLAEVRAQPPPQRVVDARGIPDEVARVEERGLLPLGEGVGALEIQQLAVVRL